MASGISNSNPVRLLNSKNRSLGSVCAESRRLRAPDRLGGVSLSGRQNRWKIWLSHSKKKTAGEVENAKFASASIPAITPRQSAGMVTASPWLRSSRVPDVCRGYLMQHYACARCAHRQRHSAASIANAFLGPRASIPAGGRWSVPKRGFHNESKVFIVTRIDPISSANCFRFRAPPQCSMPVEYNQQS